MPPPVSDAGSRTTGSPPARGVRVTCTSPAGTGAPAGPATVTGTTASRPTVTLDEPTVTVGVATEPRTHASSQTVVMPGAVTVARSRIDRPRSAGTGV